MCVDLCRLCRGREKMKTHEVLDDFNSTFTGGI
jgi:hypothetical protein